MKDDDYKVLGVDFKEKIDNDSKIILKKDNIRDYIYENNNSFRTIINNLSSLFAVLFVLLPFGLILVGAQDNSLSLWCVAIFIIVSLLGVFFLILSKALSFFKNDNFNNNYYIIVDKITRIEDINSKNCLIDFEELSKSLDYPICIDKKSVFNFDKGSKCYVFFFEKLKLTKIHNNMYYVPAGILNTDSYEVSDRLKSHIVTCDEFIKRIKK